MEDTLVLGFTGAELRLETYRYRLITGVRSRTASPSINLQIARSVRDQIDELKQVSTAKVGV